MPHNPDFKFDVFLSHSSKDKPVVRDLARRLTEGALPSDFKLTIENRKLKIDLGPLNKDRRFIPFLPIYFGSIPKDYAFCESLPSLAMDKIKGST